MFVCLLYHELLPFKSLQDDDFMVTCNGSDENHVSSIVCALENFEISLNRTTWFYSSPIIHSIVAMIE